MRILIVNNNMYIGGVQKALLNLLWEIHDSNDVTLLLLYQGGELLDRIPSDIRVLEASAPIRYWGMSGRDAKDRGELVARSVWAAIARLAGRGVGFRLAACMQPKIEGYDIAISFLHSGNPKAFYGGCAEFVLQCVDAPRKICFLHNDFRQIQAVSAYNNKIYRSFDCIAACSYGCREAFCKAMPGLADKTAIVHNCLGYKEVRRLASMEQVLLEHDCLNIVTVARLGREKGVLRALRVISELVREGYSLRYYVVGMGPEFDEDQKAAVDLGLEGTVRFLGQQSNPYPLMAACDLLLIPSYAEAAPLVIGESACLGTPILSTRTSSATEMIRDTGYGWVCDNSDEGLFLDLAALVRNPSEIRSRHGALLGMTFDDKLAVAEFENVLIGGERQ